MPERIAELEIKGTNPVLIGSSSCLMQDIPLFKEFTVGGVVRQAYAVKTDYARVPVGSRFRRHGKWYKRMTERECRLLDPCMPFADPYKIMVMFDDREKVEILEVVIRESAATREEMAS